MKVGLTGGIGTGKSTVAALLAQRGAMVIDADALAREVVAPGTSGLAAVIARFGAGVRGADGSLDRAKLGQLVFSDPAALQDLNAIVHPLVAQRTAELMAQAPADAIVVYDVPLLVENHLEGAYDAVVVVEAPLETRLLRLHERGMAADDARSRIGSQASDEERRAVASIVIDNGGTRADLQAQVDRTWAALLAMDAEQP